MKEIKVIILLFILVLLVSCTVGCTITYNDDVSEPVKNCYRFIDYSGNEYIVNMDNWYCGISKGNLHCVNNDYSKRVMVQEYEKIVCPIPEGKTTESVGNSNEN